MSDKTIIFFGAGSTVSCGMPATVTQSEFFNKYFFSDEYELRSYVKQHMNTLEGDDITVLIKLRNHDDTEKLIKFVRANFSEGSLNMQKLYNLIDMSIAERRGFKAGDVIYSVEDIVNIRKTILEVLQTLFSLLEKRILISNPEGYKKLKKLFRKIAEKQIEDRIEKVKAGENIRSKEFILTDIAYISLNWDVLILWAMLTAHKEINNENKYHIPLDQNPKLKVFNDFATILNSSDVNDKSGESDWYPYNLPVAYRLNDTEHISDRRVILFPTYFPHGQTHWLECPVCGKMTMYIDKQFRQCVPGFEMQYEKEYKCSLCETEMNLKNSAMLLQTNYKIKAPYIEEIQRSMRIELNNSDKLIFIGYSLPDDDLEYESILRISRSNPKKVYVILFELGAVKGFQPAKSIKAEHLGTDTEKTIQRYCDIFGKDNVYVNLEGFPNAYDSIISVLFG